MKTALIVILVVLAVLLLVLFAACGFIFNQLIWCKPFPIPKFIVKLIAGNFKSDKYEVERAAQLEYLKKLPIEEVILTAPDGAKLKGHVLTPEKSNGRMILACHGAHSSGLGEFCFMLPYFYEQGYAVVMPDHRGCGNSDGKFMGYGTHESVDSFLWLDYAKERFPNLSIFLLGVSMGGATVLMMSKNAEDEAIKGVIADCPYTSAWDEFSYQLHTSFHLPDFPLLHICDLYSRVIAKYSFKDASPLDAVKEAKKPVLFIHGAKDDYVPTFMQGILYDACPTEKYRLTVENAIHARSYYTNREVYEKAFAEFTDRFAV